MADDGLAAGLDDAGADEQMLPAELRVVHACRVVGEVVGLVADFLGQIGVAEADRAERRDQFADLALIQPAFLMQPDPGVPAFAVVGKQPVCQFP